MFTILFLPYVNAVIQNSNIRTYYFFKGHILKCLELLGLVELKISVFLNEDVYNITISVYQVLSRLYSFLVVQDISKMLKYDI